MPKISGDLVLRRTPLTLGSSRLCFFKKRANPGKNVVVEAPGRVADRAGPMRAIALRMALHLFPGRVAGGPNQDFLPQAQAAL
jgi:hypothetical protein